MNKTLRAVFGPSCPKILQGGSQGQVWYYHEVGKLDVYIDAKLLAHGSQALQFHIPLRVIVNRELARRPDARPKKHAVKVPRRR